MTNKLISAAISFVLNSAQNMNTEKKCINEDLKTILNILSIDKTNIENFLKLYLRNFQYLKLNELNFLENLEKALCKNIKEFFSKESDGEITYMLQISILIFISDYKMKKFYFQKFDIDEEYFFLPFEDELMDTDSVEGVVNVLHDTTYH
jgi:hypothetical protein